jgi:chemotaxis protein MotB
VAQDSHGLTLIKRKKVIAAAGHHGGAWKVAYADFVTAMMAFFLLMWLLNATTEKQRKGIADYFSPTIPISKISSGGNGSFNGDSVFTEESRAQNGTGATQDRPSPEHQAHGTTGSVRMDEAEAPPESADSELARLESLLNGSSGESSIDDELLQHVRTRITDEGLIIELFDLEDSSLFEGQTDRPTAKMQALLEMMAGIFGLVGNDIAVTGHTSAVSVVMKANPNWQLSAARAQVTRSMLTGFGVSDLRFRRVTGKADREPADENPMAARNRRMEITLLRSGR